MSSSILKDYKQYLSSDSLSQKNKSYNEIESNSKSDSKEKSQQFLKNSSDHTLVINFSYQETYKYKIICKNCKNFPQISLNDNYTLNLICNCKSKTGVTLDYFIDNYIVKDYINLISQISSKIFMENYCFCEVHTRPFTYFCDSCSRDFNKICGFNLCESCVKDNNLHINHILIFSQNKNIYSKIVFIAEFIKKQKKIIQNLYEGNENSSFENINEDYKKLLNILQIILICYEYYFCYNIHKTINSIYEFINNMDADDKVFNYNSKINNDIKQEELINVKEKPEFNYIYNNKYHENIKSIEIIKCNFNDISIFQKTNFINLELLSLSNNNITNIEPLINMKAPELKSLNLSSNKITDDYIYIFPSLNFPKLIFLSLARNFIHKHDIFGYFKKYKNLQTLYLGSNKFYDKLYDNCFKYELPTIKKLGLSQGVFSNISIKLITNFQFQNLEQMYIYGNNLDTLSFMENIECPNLKIFWGHTNNIKEFWSLKKFKDLVDINLKNNPINCLLSELIDFVKCMDSLEKLNLTNTKIVKDNEDFINAIKELKNNRIKNINIQI